MKITVVSLFFFGMVMLNQFHLKFTQLSYMSSNSCFFEVHIFGLPYHIKREITV